MPLLRLPDNAAHQGLRAEHERASDLGDQAIRAGDQGDLGQAREFIEVMARTAMGGAEWDASVAAWAEAHPGEKMITD